jgi:V/A-type H+-transporting ATPase subunit I
MLINYLGSWLGMGQVLSAPLYDGFLRMKNILPLVAMTALVGMIHLAFGFIIGAINEWNHNRKHSIAKIAWLGVELGMLMALLPAIGMADDAFMMAGIVLLALCVIILGITEGIIGIIELPGLLGNILSYTRIAAIGIVGIVIAEFLLNQFILPIPEQGIFAIVLLPLFLLFHVVNAFLAMFESLVQGGRLNIVEFRSKLLHGGGEVFSPFMLKKY